MKLSKRQLIAIVAIALATCTRAAPAAGPLNITVSGVSALPAGQLVAYGDDEVEYDTAADLTRDASTGDPNVDENANNNIHPVARQLPEPIAAPRSFKPLNARVIRSDAVLQDEVMVQDDRMLPGDDMLHGDDNPPPPFDSQNSFDGRPPMHDAAMTVAPWGGEPPARTWSSGDWFRSGMWYTAADFVVMRRSTPKQDDQRILGVDFSTGRTISEFGPKPGVEPGVRLTVGQYLGRDYLNRDKSVEFTFLGLNEFSTEDGIESAVPGFLFLPGDPGLGGFSGADTYTTEYESRFLSYEANLRLRRRLDKDRLIMAPDGTWSRQLTRGYVPSLIMGLRYASIHEDFVLRSRRDNVSSAVFGGDYQVGTDNDLFGVQIGGDCLDQHENWYWGLRGKAGAYVNFAEQNTAVFSADPDVTTSNRIESGDRAKPAFLGELSILTAYQFTPNFSLRASGDMMVATGLALAPKQVEFATTPVDDLHTGGSIFYFGLSFGAEYVW